ncbi:MAG: flagellar biosynthesis regulator FlaF [Geobacteraceae bacterium]|nr:flagellar biosynthesis regulator FlaF [Geobacteraceae bacterium]
MSNPYNIYQNLQKDGMSQRELEASVLTKAGRMLKSCQDNWSAPDRDAKLDEAIRYNQKVWSFFQSELTMPDNPLPKKLREDILSLSLFIDKRLLEVLAFPDSEKLNIVIRINFGLAEGLRMKQGENSYDQQAEAVAV